MIEGIQIMVEVRFVKQCNTRYHIIASGVCEAPLPTPHDVRKAVERALLDAITDRADRTNKHFESGKKAWETRLRRTGTTHRVTLLNPIPEVNGRTNGKVQHKNSSQL